LLRINIKIIVFIIAVVASIDEDEKFAVVAAIEKD
jgi:hypothetical protein